MIAEYEMYHGVVLRQILCASNGGAKIEPFDFQGRVDSFKINGENVVHIKYSSKRLSPWQFTLTKANLSELLEIRKRLRRIYLALICGRDGVVTLSLEEFVSISRDASGGSVFLRISRHRNEMYSVSGNADVLPFKKAEGVDPILHTSS